VTQSTRTLALNALIEAQRAGEAGRVFAIFTQVVRVIFNEVREIARSLNRDLSVEIAKLEAMARKAAEDTSDKHLVDLAQTSIELIDRSLYERSCDGRLRSVGDGREHELCLAPDARHPECLHRLSRSLAV